MADKYTCNKCGQTFEKKPDKHEVMTYTSCKKVSGLNYDTMCRADTISHKGGHSWREYQQARKYARNWESCCRACILEDPSSVTS